jgi:peptidoglycan hydrolase-like protein with peptidoglycan-binding domain
LNSEVKEIVMFKFRKMLLATTATILLTGPGLAAPIDTNGPSFDCSHGVKSALAQVLCAGPGAAQADWDLNAAVWAYHADNPTAGNKNLENWSHSMNDRCRLPRPLSQDEQVGRAMAGQIGRMVLGTEFRIPGQQPITQEHVNCVVSLFHQEAASLRSKLRGDALAESKLTPEEHVEIQQALIDKGFLQNRTKGYGAEADGQFGPNTRIAIKQFQQSIGASQTGFLSQEQMTTLLETPDEVEARKARAKQMKQAAIEAEKRKAELQSKIQAANPTIQRCVAQQEPPRPYSADRYIETMTTALERCQASYDDEVRRKEAAEQAARRKQEIDNKIAAADVAVRQCVSKLEPSKPYSVDYYIQTMTSALSSCQANFDAENERNRLEAEKAKEWREKIERARSKSIEYANTNPVKWAISGRYNEMTDGTDYTVYSKQQFGPPWPRARRATAQRQGNPGTEQAQFALFRA